MNELVAVYTGGFFQTNAYALPAPPPAAPAAGAAAAAAARAPGPRPCVLVDAPEGCADWLEAEGWRVAALLLTHAHIDHVHDAAAIARAHGCPVYHHPDGLPLLRDRDAYRRFGLSLELEPVTGGTFLDETAAATFAGWTFRVLAVPGHCPGSLCFYHAPGRLLLSGDTLMRGTVGRWDLPGGDRDLLLDGIRRKLFTLSDDVVVLPGHGPATTVGAERRANPVLAAAGAGVTTD